MLFQIPSCTSRCLFLSVSLFVGLFIGQRDQRVSDGVSVWSIQIDDDIRSSPPFPLSLSCCSIVVAFFSASRFVEIRQYDGVAAHRSVYTLIVQGYWMYTCLF